MPKNATEMRPCRRTGGNGSNVVGSPTVEEELLAIVAHEAGSEQKRFTREEHEVERPGLLSTLYVTYRGLRLRAGP